MSWGPLLGGYCSGILSSDRLSGSPVRRCPILEIFEDFREFLEILEDVQLFSMFFAESSIRFRDRWFMRGMGIVKHDGRWAEDHFWRGIVLVFTRGVWGFEKCRSRSPKMRKPPCCGAISCWKWSRGVPRDTSELRRSTRSVSGSASRRHFSRSTGSWFFHPSRKERVSVPARVRTGLRGVSSIFSSANFTTIRRDNEDDPEAAEALQYKLQSGLKSKINFDLRGNSCLCPTSGK